MPELPEVETIARGLHGSLCGRTVAGVRVLWPGSVHDGDATGRDMKAQPGRLQALVPGSLFVGARRRAKLLLLDLISPKGRDNRELTLAFHLKMTGRVVHEVTREVQTHDRVRFLLRDNTVLTFADVRKFGYVRLFLPGEMEQWKFWRNLGPEPLETDAGLLARSVAQRKARIKGLLLDQTVVAGVGNIYADESLFRAGIRPDTRACDVPPDRLAALFRHLQDVLLQAIAENGSSIRDYVNADGDAGAFQNSFNVYGKKGQCCPRCRAELVSSTVAGRTSTFCPCCQK